jgi:hypothetical protein
MNSRHGIMVVTAVSLLGLAGVTDLRAAEDRPASFDCTKDRSPLAVTVCNDRTAIAAERRATASYFAVYYGLNDESRPGFHNDHMQWLNGVAARCSPSPNLRQPGEEQLPLSAECVRRSYTQRGDLYRKRLSGAALEESNLSPALMKKIQRRLVDLKLLSGTVDGVFGADTRAAIRSYQGSIGHAPSNFLTAQERNMLLAANPLPAQTAASKQVPVAAPEAVSEAAPAPPPTVQNLESADHRSRELATTEPAPEQPVQQNAPDAANPPAHADTDAPLDTGGGPQTQYFIAGALLAMAILAFAAGLVFMRLRRRTKRAIADDDFGQVAGAPSGISFKIGPLRTRAATGKPVDPSILSSVHVSGGSNPPQGAAVVHVDAPLAPERVVELLPHLEKGTKP